MPDNEIGKSLRNGHKKESGNGTIRIWEWDYKNLGMRLKEDGIGKGEAMYLGMKDKECQNETGPG